MEDPNMLAMPLLIINMGGEMMYILEQRLQAQNIVSDKSARVLQDVISTMFSKRFVTELFKPQKMYSNESTRQIFDKLAHSSIMRLNKTSMDKLYDLMTMGCKYQVLSCSDPKDMLQVTLNHLDALTILIEGSSASPLVSLCSRKFLDGYRNLTRSQWATLRLRLCSFFQDRRVKVSLFLADQIQAQDGSIIISHAGILPEGAEMPGTVRYFDTNNKVAQTTDVNCLNKENVQPPLLHVDPFSPQRPVVLGRNLYSKDRDNSAPKAPVPSAPVKRPIEDYEPDQEASEAAKNELNALTQFIGQSSVTEKLNINLFPDSDALEDVSGKDSSFIVFDTSGNQSKNALKAEMEDWNTQQNNEDDDLLAMMDSLET